MKRIGKLIMTERMSNEADIFIRDL